RRAPRGAQGVQGAVFAVHTQGLRAVSRLCKAAIGRAWEPNRRRPTVGGGGRFRAQDWRNELDGAFPAVGVQAEIRTQIQQSCEGLSGSMGSDRMAPDRSDPRSSPA